LMEFRFVQRPENFLYLAIAATLYFIEMYRFRSNWRYLTVIPFIGFALSQIHPSVILLGLIIGTYIVEAIFLKDPDTTQALQLGLATFFTLSISLINPSGLEQLILPLSFH